MNRREFIKTVGLGAVSLAVPGCANALKQVCGRDAIEKPSFVVIFCDDLGYADVGCFGAKGFKTPNLDRMAAEGIRFTDFYSAAPSCTPSRAALMTGCYPQRISLPKVLFPRSEDGISSDETTIAELLKTRGYATACYGKWHLGHHPEFLPTRHGFDKYFGLPYSNDMSPDPANNHFPQADRYPPLPLIEGEQVIETEPDQSKLTTWYTERAVGFIEANKERPFFLYLAHSMPHVPLYVSDKFKGRSKQGLYGDVVMEIDWSVGQVLSTLKQLGIDEKTLVIFTSDNGPWLLFGDHGGSAKPLREGKSTTFDGGMREACIMRWPGRIAAATVCDEPATTMDVLPTLAKLAGAKLPERRIDGKDIWPLMSSQPGAVSGHKAIFYYRGWRLDAVRSGRWKLHLPHPYLSFAEPGSGGKPGRYDRKKIELSLFDLKKDIAEQHNLVHQRPDVVERLMKLVDKMRQDLGDSAKNTEGKNRRPAGHI